ncbi:MAG: NADH-quinone oxidoreductase subunit L [Actinomycetota bacterium]|nr:NADH-quinone oxidoreductase subunit L [Actinomycetota bacterium]
MNDLELAALVACGLPMLAAIANGVNALAAGRLYGPASVSRVAVAGVFGSFAASVWVAAAMARQAGPHEIVVYRWFVSGDLAVDFAFLIDELTIVMMLVVTAISWLVTRFSVNYMHNEPGFTRYFTIVPLFVFAMLVLVMADNYLLLFLGWEGVGVCSYLLVGFYRGRTGAAQAGTRAFIMNRVGDAELLLALFLLFVYTGSLQFGDVFAAADSLSSGVVTGVCFLLLFGAVGKSAQLPLGTWLANAMEGPTPSSALIHAATMVTAGVYLVARSSPLFDAAPTALLAVGLVGSLTALYGQLVGYVQTDIKGMLAASTTAQLGLMFVFCGLGLYAVAIFHLVAHAFYKSYLFLTAPSILHHLHGGADPAAIRRPANNAPLLSHLVLAVAVGLLALPLLARGLFDGEQALEGSVLALASLAVVAVFSVVFATSRMVREAFASHGTDDHLDDAHDRDLQERTPVRRMLGPMVVIAVLVALGWAAGVLPGGIEGTWFYGLLDEVAGVGAALPAGNPLMAGLFVGALALLAVSGVYGPRFLDRFRDELPAGAVPPVARRLYWRALDRGLLDENYTRAIVGPTVALGRLLRRFDRRVIDRATGAAAHTGAPSGADPDWEARFTTVRRAHNAGFVTLSEPPERLDWLPPTGTRAGRAAAPRHGMGEHVRAVTTAVSMRAESRGGAGVGVVEQAGTGLARFREAVERRVFQGSPERGASFFTSTIARSVEAVERVVFQANLDRVAALMTGAIARFTELVEHAVFQSGLERGLRRAGIGTQRSLLAVEARLGQPLFMGGLLGVVLIVLVAGTR